MTFFKDEELNKKLIKIDTKLGWIDTTLDEIKKEQEEGEKRQKYLIEKQVELYAMIKKYLDKHETYDEEDVEIQIKEFDNKIKGTTKFT